MPMISSLRLETRTSLEIAQNLIQAWMSKRGLELSAEKTAITSMEDGFDFLGFNSRHYDGKLLNQAVQKEGVSLL